jgi:hypothetical protein
MLGSLARALAWDDPGLRPVADYFRMAGLLGASQGRLRPWPLDVYSEPTRLKVVAGQLTNGIVWDEWSVGLW